MRVDNLNSPDLGDWLKAKIVGVGVGGKKQFWMAHEKRDALMQALFAGDMATDNMIDDGITSRHMIDNYALIQKELSARLLSRHKLDTFIYYFLVMVVIINLEVTPPTYRWYSRSLTIAELVCSPTRF